MYRKYKNQFRLPEEISERLRRICGNRAGGKKQNKWPAGGDFRLGEHGAKDVSRYQNARIAEKASPKTINLEIGTLRAILRRHRVWAEIPQDVRMLPTLDDVGHALTCEEETALLSACLQSRSRLLYPAVMLALHTGMR